MSDDVLTHCKAALSNVIASDVVQQSDNPFKEFADGIRNFVQHYCWDSHASSWCHHPKVTQTIIKPLYVDAFPALIYNFFKLYHSGEL